MGGKNQFLSSVGPTLKFGSGPVVVFVPGADGSDQAAGITEITHHTERVDGV
jgi:hypothetical protein